MVKNSTHFEINLDRPSGVFCAGEVVTGSMTLHASGETCRSLQISMVGEANVYWSVGGGDNKQDYHGKKIFLDSERTLWGNFYRTTVLDYAGADAEFGGAMGDGDMYIPCLPNEGSDGGPMKLIVRVCGYSWRKKDDNLGEILLDGKELAMHGDAKTYSLLRDGKPEQGTVTIAAKFVPTSAITPNSDRQTAQSQETLVLKVLKANGLRKASMLGSPNDVFVQVWRAPDNLVTPPPVGKKLPEPDMKITLPHQVMHFKFAFPTRADSPGSAVVRCGEHAYIAYYIKAEIDKKSSYDPFLKYPITIIPLRPAPMPQLLSQFMIEEENQIKKTKIYCLACGEAGMVTIKLNSRRAYAPGETLQLTGSQVMNSSSISVSVRVIIRQTIQLATTGAYDENTQKGYQKFEMGSKEVGPGSSIGLDEFHAVVPALPPSFFGARGSSTATQEPLTFTYELSLQAKASSGHKVKVDMPILISALPPKQQAIQDAATSNNQVPIYKPFEIQSYAVTDDSPCSTVIMATGLEDGARKIVDSATGAANLYAPVDRGAYFAPGSSGTLMYQPQVATFQSTSNTIEEAIAPADFGKNAADHATAHSALVKNMKFNTDTRLVVNKWIKEYPTATASLTSDGFAGVLKKVLFSLEQAAVARELTSGMGNGVLTTEYIMKSIDACPYSKVELVRVMAPYVSDSGNKGVVLEQLHSFERKEASKMFVR